MNSVDVSLNQRSKNNNQVLMILYHGI